MFKTGKLLTLIALLCSGHVVAEKSEPLLNFKFNHLSNSLNNNYLSDFVPTSSSKKLEFEQFDATWTYPWETNNMSLDLGVTLRHLSGVNSSLENTGDSYFQEVLPLVHASALYSLPLKGLSAGFEGSHLGSSTRQVVDYRAKVSYEWREGFGLHGGWQHQQFHLNNVTEAGTEYEKNGPFIDFYLNF